MGMRYTTPSTKRVISYTGRMQQATNTSSLTHFEPIDLLKSYILFVNWKEPIQEENMIVAASNNAVSLNVFFIIV